MQLPPNRLLFFWSLPIIASLAACEAKPECDSPETRKAVLDFVSDDHRNPLVEFAARNSTAKANLESRKPLYLLGEKIVTTSSSNGKRTLQCSGAISVTVGDVKASKEIEFAVQRSEDGKRSVSVTPFQF
ncbi:hypothetical protein [Bradyrhizobium japonicum]|jgi:hypothetical protein|uniref:hypothetical protein n=1 Tax=Bradyrhizobium japonicum TaxID=375 RepID=UPI00209DC13A|nr:hypothetical protein [Bradyrhizobium japonicum]MCP1762380.1 hypothetical protein [Bradyrhizobium japonicum]MCP1793960.1 hypothetical protein [Bradyrhizobium japonicum]MCP1806393.1 hypothetical protein [Bradyrhizobium japonicum]MCP1815321.1 hypothetical protein [Bradyrhizobium japonicum]MCP1873162.1 hypothetical protein [Bradyrhizobium japonicum]